MSSVRQVVQTMQYECGVAEEASVWSQVEGKMHRLVAQAEVGTLRAIVEVCQRLEQGL